MTILECLTVFNAFMLVVVFWYIKETKVNTTNDIKRNCKFNDNEHSHIKESLWDTKQRLYKLYDALEYTYIDERVIEAMKKDKS